MYKESLKKHFTLLYKTIEIKFLKIIIFWILGFERNKFEKLYVLGQVLGFGLGVGQCTATLYLFK